MLFQAHRGQRLGGEDILIKMSYKKLVEREVERQEAIAGIQTKLLRQPGVGIILVISVLTPSLPATRRSTS